MAYDVQIERTGIEALIDIQGSAETLRDWVGEKCPPLPQQANSASSQDGLSLCWIGPERWLLRAPIEREDELLAITRPASAPLDISIVLVSDTLCFFRIDGADAAQVVAIACPLDTHASAFPENGISYTEIFGIKGLLARRGDGFDLAIESSFGDMVEDYLQRANA